MMIAEKLAKIQRRLTDTATACGRDPDTIRLLAVSKRQPTTAIRAAAAAGLQHFAESFVQEALPKLLELDECSLTWHFIGPIQSNKTRAIAEHFSWVHSLCRDKIATRLNASRPETLPPLNVCIEVNTSNEAQKAGVNPEAVTALAKHISTLPRLRLRGLMTIPKKTNDLETTRASFELLQHCFSELKQEGYSLDTLSMGMSRDFETAIQAGSTCIRVGTALFSVDNPE